MTFKESSNKKTDLYWNDFGEADKPLKDYIHQVLTDHITIESLMEDIIVIYFCEKEKISDFQEIIFPRLPFDKKLQILEQILRIANLETDYGDLAKSVGIFSVHRNAIAHRRRGWSVLKEDVTYDLSRRKDGKTQKYELSESQRTEVISLGVSCVINLRNLTDIFRRKYLE
ncbi:MAG: hypothetical protein OER82_03870 [Nitrosopumilus sp.]|nr:hypothetical protein [Nitrosopumilus sp.]